MITVGTDIIDVARVAAKRDALTRRILLPSEKEYCLSQATPEVHMAGRFAAKEAVFKALRVLDDAGMSWLDIEIARDGDGAPRVILHGTAEKYAREHGLQHLEVSISHVREFAVATAACEWRNPGSGENGA